MAAPQEPQEVRPATSLDERLRSGPGEWVPLEEFGPLPRSLEWRLARRFWDLRGPKAFFGGEVPYAVINDGRLSADAARLLVELRVGAKPGPVRILEVGGGSGLFAKLFLEELRVLSPAIYEATTYVWTDASPTMLKQAEAEGAFGEHAGHVRTHLLPLPGMAALGELAGEGFDLVIANYLLDNLPATLLRLSSGGIEELEVRTTLRADLAPARLGGRSPRERKERARANGEADAELVDLYPWFSLECRRRSVDRASFKYGAVIPAEEGAPEFWTHHEMAWTWLKETMPLIRPGGGVLMSDYGHHPRRKPDRYNANQHFGGSMANGINFDELESLPRLEPDWQATAPETDSKHVQSRWMCRRGDALSTGLFRLIFDGQRRDRVSDLMEQARERAEDGRVEQARWLFYRAHRLAPRSWHLLEMWAAFCLGRLHDAVTARELIEKAIHLHPRHPMLWNIKGDTFYEQKNFTEAEACYRKAMELNPREIRGRLNLAYVQLDTGRYKEALVALAEALGLDTQGDHREALLEKQKQVLVRMTIEARDAVAQQVNRFRNLDAPD